MTDSMIIMGTPTVPVEDERGLDPDKCVYIDRLGELAEEASTWDEDYVLQQLLAHAREGRKLYIAHPVTPDERAILDKFVERKPNGVIDEAYELIAAQVQGVATGPLEFEDHFIAACEQAGVAGDKVVFGTAEDVNTAVFWQPNRPAQQHTVTWMPDATVEVDGMVLRCSAIVGHGHYFNKVIVAEHTGGIKGVLQPKQVAAFIARRLATAGINDLLGYGRAFGPGKEDVTNATLTEYGREFRSAGVVGVVEATLERVGKARYERVNEVAETIHKLNPDTFVLPHQQGRELYVGDAALKAFRGTMKDGKVTLHGKSAKHVRVDAGSYCLYTASGNGLITIPVVVGMFEESNGGCVFAPRQLVDDLLVGYLKENVRAVKDHANMSDDLVSRYYTSDILVTEGQRIEPDEVLFVVDGIEHCWETKADYGIVTRIVDEATSAIIRTEVYVDAYFTGDAKLRGPVKAMVAPLEASGMGITVKRNGRRDNTPRFVIGAPGAIKDSAAFKAHLRNVKPCFAALTTQYCQRDLERAMAKHGPLEDGLGGLKIREYPKCGVTLAFDDGARRNITTMDPNAFTADLDVMIEASPVAQSIGSSGMTLPQLGWLSGPDMPTGNDWLVENVLPGIIKRTRALGYMHAVAGNIEHATLGR